MNTLLYSEILTLAPEDNHRLFNLCGKLNEHLKLIENRLGVMIKQRGHTFSVSGERHAVKQACDTLNNLYEETEKVSILEPKEIHLYLQTVGKRVESGHQEDHMEIRLRKGVITARGENQVHYIRSILQHDINFGIGPAGTGKTYLAVACAVQALETERVSRIILVRPIVEAGEKLGFLPGDIAQKVHPYLRPLYDALYEMIGFEKVTQLIEKDVIELLPLAYMRGRSLNDSFIILDEGQNTTIEQMKMFLTRIGFNSKAVVTGDITQIDLNNRRDSGLIHAREVLKDVSGIGFTQFQISDVVRHPLVQTIVEAYEDHENKKQNQK
ncbi:PhoH family protein [Aquicella lusitana]|uniref:PhoH-like protein n=1 Tax=Aquicella lusitana TaxID=254246 RepID=A0A370G8V0_9COXI|nr:PhoH family protein [Aquicella lusitana]RDI40191.1 phosphate starvation-inducible PhoH-like protein [Aquicella lusitana]VVC72418.1 PhoH-like protein [Aquicella lusitana]